MDLRQFLKCYEILNHFGMFYKLSEEQKFEAVIRLSSILSGKDTASVAM